MKRKAKGVITVLFTSIFVMLFVWGIDIYVNRQIQPTLVYEFARDIPVNSKIEASDLRSVQIPKSAVKSSMILNPDEIIGKYNNTQVYEGEYVIQDKLVDKEDIDPFESMDLSKLRLITIPADYTSALGGDIKRGDRIDLIYVGEETKGDKEFTYSKTIMTNVLVYATNTEDGYKYVNKAQSIKGESYEGEDYNSSETGGLGSITLAVTLPQAEEISSRMKTGSIQIIGRFAESEDYETSGYVNGDYVKIFSGQANVETN